MFSSPIVKGTTFLQPPSLPSAAQITQAYLAGNAVGARSWLDLVINRRTGAVLVALPSDYGEFSTVILETAGSSGAQPDGRLILSALDASVHGKAARLESDPGNHRIGYWTNDSDTVTWDFPFPRWGMYFVELTYALAGDRANEVTVTVGDRPLSTPLASTGSWYRYRTISLGKIYLPEAGPRRVAVKCAELREAAVMNLKALTLRPAPEGLAIHQGADGQILLRAQDATVHGLNLRYEPAGKKNCLGFWTNLHDWAEWRFHLHRPGVFEVILEQGCGRGQGGSQVEIRSRNQTLGFTVEDTGHFQNWRKRTIGRLEFKEAGWSSLSIHALRKAKDAVMDVKSIHLVPVK